MTIRIVPAESEMTYSEEYYAWLAEALGEERAAWARVSPEERDQELRWYHANFDTPDDLALWPPELDGGVLKKPSLTEGGDEPPPSAAVLEWLRQFDRAWSMRERVSSGGRSPLSFGEIERRR